MLIEPPHPATLADAELLKQCEMTFGRSAGPGGQHRNKVSTAVALTHRPTGVQSYASERRRQIENRSMALRRMRLKLAVEARVRVHPREHRPSELWESRRQGRQMSINPNHKDYASLLAEALDVIVARRFDVAGAAGVLGVTMSQLAKLVRHDKHAFAVINEGRVKQGLPLLK